MLSRFRVGNESTANASKPQRLNAERAYVIPPLRKRLSGKRNGVCIARKGLDSRERHGRRR